MYTNVHLNTVYNSQDIEANWISIGRRMDKKAVVRIHNGILLSYYSAIKNNSFQSVVMRWMKLEPIIQSEVSQKNTNIVY